MHSAIKAAAVMALGVGMVGCAAKGQQANLADTRVAALEDQVAALQQRVDEVTQAQQTTDVISGGRSVEHTMAPSSTKKLSVRQVQRALTASGHYQGAIDGKQGPQTRKAVKDFQEANGLKADGVVGPATTEALSKYLPE